MKRLLFDGTKAANLDSLPAEAWTVISGQTPGSDDLAETVRTVPVLRRAVTLVADAVGSTPFVLRRGNTEIDTSAEYANVLGVLPNLPALLSLIASSMWVWGSAYLFAGRNRGKRVKEIRYLAPTTIRPDLTPDGLQGFTRLLGSQQISLAPDEVIHFWLPDPAIELGPPTWSPVRAALNAAHVLGSMEKFTTSFFDRGAIKATLLAVPATTRQADRKTLRDWWRTVFGGVNNAFSTEVINADDVKPVVIGEGIESLSNVALTREKREDIAVALGIPYSLLFPDAANYATAQQDDRHFWQKTIIPACGMIAGVFNDQLLKAFDCVLEFRPEGLDAMQEDEAARASAFSAYVGAGIKPSIVAQMLGMELPEGIEYEDLDPEPEPQPQPQPDAQTQPEQDNGQQQEGDMQPTGKAVQSWEKSARAESDPSADLRRWRDKALSALKRGEAAAVPFVSTTIPADRWHHIAGALKAAQTADDVRAAFVAPTPATQPDIAALLEGIRMGVAALAVKADDEGGDGGDEGSSGPFATARQRRWFFSEGPGAGSDKPAGENGKGKGKTPKGGSTDGDKPTDTGLVHGARTAAEVRAALANASGIISGFEKRIAEIDSEIKEKSDLRSAINAERRLSVPKVGETNPEVWDKYRKLIDQDRAVLAEISSLTREKADICDSIKASAADARRLVYAPTPATITGVLRGKGLRGMDKIYMDEGIDEFQKIVGAGIVDGQVFGYGKADGRSYYENNAIYLDNDSDPGVVVHELGHWLESYGDTYAEAQAFLDRRTAGEEVRRLQDITGRFGYGKSETATPDKFIEPYMGKRYATAMRATEIISMGLEFLWRDPGRLARDDPDYFDFMWNLLRRQR